MGRRVGLRLASALAALGGCEQGGASFAFVERDDVILSVPAPRAGGDAPQGEAHELVATTATAIDGSVAEIVGAIVDVEAALADHRETRREGAFRIYGPFDDPDGRDVAWLVKIDGGDAAARFEILVAPRGTLDEDAFVVALHGDIDDDGRRTGEVVIEYAAIDARSDLRPSGERLAGRATIAFDRAPDEGDARVEIRFEAFVREDAAGTTWASDETLLRTRDGTGGGSLRVVLGTDTVAPATGVLAELAIGTVELDARWDSAAAGRARARAAAPANPDSALSHGDLVVHECFEGGGGLTFRALNEPYAADRPSYAFGDVASCVFTDSDLGTP
jgi:hypothetical protein